MKKKGNEIESICSSSSNARLLTKACNSVKASCCSSNRTHIKRRRSHMAQQGKKTKRSMRDDAAQLLAEDCTPDPMFLACFNNRDAFIKLLQSACDGTDRSMGSPRSRSLGFWQKFTERWVWDLKLKIVITKETVETCMRFGKSLKSLHHEFERDPRELGRRRREQLESEPPELSQNLFKIFGQCNPHFSEETSKSARSSTSSGPSRLSDASIHKPPFDLDLRRQLDEVVEGLEAAGQLHMKDIPQVVSFFTSCETTARIFLKYDTERRISKINDLLNEWNQGH